MSDGLAPASDSFALRLQLMPRARDKTLVMAALVAARSEKGIFQPVHLTRGFNDLAVPAPANISACLAALKHDQFLVQPAASQWRLTPLGKKASTDLLGLIDAKTLEEATAGSPSAEFAHVQHTVIPAWAAPPRWQVGIRRLLADHPFERNVFCMTRFPSEGPIADPVAEAIEETRKALSSHGLTMHLASDRLIDDDLLGNVGAYMWACQYGIGIVEDRVGRGLNYNAVLEIGGMMITGRRCAVLKDVGTPNLPTDLSGQIYRSVDLSNPNTVRDAVDAWVTKDLRIP